MTPACLYLCQPSAPMTQCPRRHTREMDGEELHQLHVPLPKREQGEEKTCQLGSLHLESTYAPGPWGRAVRALATAHLCALSRHLGQPAGAAPRTHPLGQPLAAPPRGAAAWLLALAASGAVLCEVGHPSLPCGALCWGWDQECNQPVSQHSTDMWTSSRIRWFES